MSLVSLCPVHLMGNHLKDILSLWQVPGIHIAKLLSKSFTPIFNALCSLRCTDGVTVSPAKAWVPFKILVISARKNKKQKTKHVVVLFIFFLNSIIEFEECTVLALSQMYFQFYLMFSDFLC